jgi:hypothetical protein
MEIGETLYVTTRDEFRAWLMENHLFKREIWLVQYKKATKKPSINYIEAVEEAICFGWIDGFEKGLDAERYATRFTPRRPKSNWTETNKERARKMIAMGRMTEAGRAALPPDLEMNCPECGAPDSACATRFDECLVLEFSDADYGAVHHLTVATYMLQHSSKLTREGWLHERELLREFLIENKPPAFIRKQNKDKVDSGKRDFKIKSKTGQRIIGKSTWTKTILDVRTDSAKTYCADVTAWARSALAEVETAG